MSEFDTSDIETSGDIAIVGMAAQLLRHGFERTGIGQIPNLVHKINKQCQI